VKKPVEMDDRFVRWLDDDWLETELEGKP